ncbi:GntR family transcriptional regulator [Agromyces aerolatus]|uniref:GntR family transcriptional regulator n=1 Tax=Agromyces sp. LY-1074 TaxID=3074080 RepID=UPI00286768DB|nr:MULTISPECIES: GntR family transcriptional regulator [unclassified Agromyces]MDR5700904.1 GntR family transcriptional regulator [Agromyces sp. LY-1074]MDR5707435.1 GntR family transcriptional regulator [Agromyces sp. LY-1358]
MAESAGRTPTQVDLATMRLERLIEQQRRDGDLRLPRETELGEQLGISRNTLREALARLAARGLIDRRRRLGTFITAAPAEASGETFDPRALAYPIDDIVTLPAFFEDAGAPYAIRSVSVETEPASAADGARLGVAEGSPLYRVRRVFALDGTGAVIGEHLLPTVLDGHGVHIEALTDGISTFLRDVERINIDVVRHQVTALAGDFATARDLALPIGAPVLAVDAELCTRDGAELRIVALGRLIFNPALVSLRATGSAAPAHTSRPA